MIVTVVGTWDIGWNTPIKEAELWQFTLAEYIVDQWFMSPISGIASGVPWLVEDAQMETRLALERAAGRTLVFVDEAAEVELLDYPHPTDACYVLGKTGFSPYVSFYDETKGDEAVSIATRVNQGGFWPHQAISMVLQDRFRKLG